MLEVNRDVEVLNNRKDEDLFLQDVERLRTEASRLRALNIDMSTLKLVMVDRQAQEPLKPIKPRKALIIALCLVVGLMLGTLAALIGHFVQIRRENGPFSMGSDPRLPVR